MAEKVAGNPTLSVEQQKKTTEAGRTERQTMDQTTEGAVAQGNAGMDGQDERKAVSGVFSLQEVRKVGTGTTTRKTIQKSFWFADEQPDGSVELQLLNSNYIPAGPKQTVPLDVFIATYSPEPEFYVSNVFPKMKELNKTVARADRYRANNELFSAEMEYNNALKLDIENIKANFGLGITYMERGETDKAENILERLVKLDAAFDREHKHLFNDFGINLRKSGMLRQAVDYYKRALELSQKDENLYYNLARAYLELKQIEACVSTLLVALNINPTHEVSTKFLMWMVQKKLIPEGQQANVLQGLRAVQQAQQGAKGDSQGQPEAPRTQNASVAPADSASPAQPASSTSSAGTDSPDTLDTLDTLDTPTDPGNPDGA